MHLRKATKEDETKIFSLVKQVLSEYGLEVNPKETDKDLSDLDKYYFNNNGWFAVIEKDDKIIGSYGLYKIDNATCELRKMYLDNSFQGQGFGKRMMNDAFIKAAELGYSKIILETNKILTKAIELYKKYGFVEFQPDHLSDRCDFAMEKEL